MTGARDSGRDVGFDVSWSWRCLLKVERTVSQWNALFKILALHFILIKTQEKETLQHTLQLVKTVVKEIAKVESSKQIRSLACCSMTMDSKSRLVAPAVPTECPVIQEYARCRLHREEQQAFDLVSDKERETARIMVSRLHVELGHSDPRRKHAHRLIIAAAKKLSSSACAESQRRRLHPVAARVLHEPGTCLQVDQFEWNHPVLNLHVLGTIMVDAGSRAASVTIHRVMDTKHGLGHVTAEIMLNTLLNHWIKHCGKSNIVRTDPEFRDQGFRRGLAAKSSASTLILGARPGKQECMGKHWILSNSQQHGWLGKLLTVSQFTKSLMNTLRLTMTHIEIEDSLRGSCCRERHRHTLSLRKSCLAQCSVQVVDEAAK